jgi:outer membrane protein assembly factor BamB
MFGSKKLARLESSFMKTFATLVFLSFLPSAVVADWPQFRGPDGGVSNETVLPLTWSAEENVLWAAPLPGFGASSPITVGTKVLLTCYSGYGLEAKKPGEQSALRLHLLCYNLESGKQLWRKDVQPVLPDQDYQGWLPEHGYASGTPASDGEAVYVFFGRAGLHAFDLDGTFLWKANAGTETHGFGTATSPLLYRNMVIINACVESDALIAFDKKTGKEMWKNPGIKRAWSTPVLVETAEGKQEIVLSAEGAVIGYDPDDGKTLWTCEGINDYVCPSVVADDGIVYAIGGRKEVRSLAVRAGGRGDVTATHRLWKTAHGSKVPSPIYHDGHLYWVEHTGIAFCMNAKTGDVVYKERLAADQQGKTYASAVLAAGRLYVVTCQGGTFVLEAKPQFKQLAHNVLGDDSVFNASPAVVPGRLLLRSDRFLYCLGDK